jgi:DNA helicase-2/ATP-dependent DNA helicase PcrA
VSGGRPARGRPGEDRPEGIGARALDPAQRSAVEAPAGPLLVLAGAGSGKTRVLTERAAALVASGEVSSGALLCLTFTNRAAEELCARLGALLSQRAALRATIGTFHSLCYRMLRGAPRRAGLAAGFSVYDQADSQRVIARALADTGAGADLAPALVARQISQAKARLLDPGRYRAMRDSERVGRVARAWERYEALMRESNAADFDDLLVKAVTLLSAPDLLEAWQRRFEGVLVDEYQDTNPAQSELLRRLCHVHRNLTAVGCADQAIYRFRGAEVRNLLGFGEDFPGARVVKLERNYRSSAAIVSAAARLVAHNALRPETTMRSEARAGLAVRACGYDSVDDEAAASAAWCRALLDGGAQASEVAVLFRTRRQARALEDALLACSVAVRIVGARSLYETAAVRDLLAYVRLVANPCDQAAAVRALGTRAGVGPRSIAQVLGAVPGEGGDLVRTCLGARSIAGLAERQGRSVSELGRALERLRGKGVAACVEGALAELAAARAKPSESADAERVERVVSAARVYERESPAPGLADFLAHAALEAGEGEEASERVTLATLHGAKGAEWERVWLAGLSDGVLPHARSQEGEALEEERRLCYVGMTRARAELVLSFARAEGRRRFRPSRFLAEAGLARRRREAA